MISERIKATMARSKSRLGLQHKIKLQKRYRRRNVHIEQGKTKILLQNSVSGFPLTFHFCNEALLGLARALCGL